MTETERATSGWADDGGTARRRSGVAARAEERGAAGRRRGAAAERS